MGATASEVVVVGEDAGAKGAAAWAGDVPAAVVLAALSAAALVALASSAAVCLMAAAAARSSLAAWTTVALGRLQLEQSV